MPTSQNGWPASPNLPRRKLIVNGVEFVGGILDNDDVETVLSYVLTQFDERVERLRNPGCWGGNYRANRNNPNSLSNHASWTAVDANAPAHPNGVPTSRTFSAAQIAEVHKILAEVNHVIRWGGDYSGTPDAMHFEVNTNAATLHDVAERLRGANDMTPEQAKQLDGLTKAIAGLAEMVEALADGNEAIKRRITKSKREVLDAVKQQP